MSSLRSGVLVAALGAALAGLLAGDAATIASAPAGDAASAVRAAAPRATAVRAIWAEVKWPFPLDQWGTGRAFQCRAADCGAEINLYLRAKLGFCNCTTGVSDDAELDRVGDLELLSEKFEGLAEGRPIAVRWMSGRSRPYQVTIPYAPPRTALAIAFNDKCDVVVATVVAERERLALAEGAALDFLNSDLVLRWAERELGL
jgi:hypothetical protein